MKNKRSKKERYWVLLSCHCNWNSCLALRMGVSQKERTKVFHPQISLWDLSATGAIANRLKLTLIPTPCPQSPFFPAALRREQRSPWTPTQQSSSSGHPKSHRRQEGLFPIPPHHLQQDGKSLGGWVMELRWVGLVFRVSLKRRQTSPRDLHVESLFGEESHPRYLFRADPFWPLWKSML